MRAQTGSRRVSVTIVEPRVPASFPFLFLELQVDYCVNILLLNILNDFWPLESQE